MLYEKTLESRKQQSKIDNIFTRLLRWVISFESIKVSKNNLSSLSDPFFEKFGFNEPSLHRTKFLGRFRVRYNGVPL